MLQAASHWLGKLSTRGSSQHLLVLSFVCELLHVFDLLIISLLLCLINHIFLIAISLLTKSSGSATLLRRSYRALKSLWQRVLSNDVLG